MRQGLFKGYKPNRLSLYLLMLSSGRSDELYDVIMKDMEEYKEEEPFYLINHTTYKVMGIKCLENICLKEKKQEMYILYTIGKTLLCMI